MSIVLGDELKAIINGALANGTPMLIAVVTADGKPRMSFRGSLQAIGDDQLGFWARRLEGATVEGVKVNPDVALLYRDGPKRVILQIAGRARIAADPAERDRVYEAAPEVEQRADPERKGGGLIIDLDRIEGMLGLNAEGKPNLFRQTRED